MRDDRCCSPPFALVVSLLAISWLAIGVSWGQAVSPDSSVLAQLAAPSPAPHSADPTSVADATDLLDGADDETTAWLGADGEPMPFATAAEVRGFLRHAEVVSVEAILNGSTRPKKLLLELDGIRAHAIFRDVDVSRTWVKLDDGSFHLRFRDYDLFEVAAYEMAMLLGMDNVPPTVVRRIGAATGSLQLWIENIISSGRLEGGLRPPDYAAWSAQLQAMELFDYVILNIDRNTGNYLIDADWKLWMIDHTRTFQVTETTPSAEHIVRCEPRTWARLQAIDATAIDQTLGSLLTFVERSRLLRRVEHLREHIAALIEAHGVDAVIY